MDKEYMDKLYGNHKVPKVTSTVDKKYSISKVEETPTRLSKINYNSINIKYTDENKSTNNLISIRSIRNEDYKKKVIKKPKRLNDDEVKFLLDVVDNDCNITLASLKSQIENKYGKIIGIHTISAYLQTLRSGIKNIRIMGRRKIREEQEKNEKPKRKYKEISDEKREDLIRLADSTDLCLKEIADFLQINLRTARKILNLYHRTGVLKKKERNKTRAKILTNEEIACLWWKLNEECCTLNELKEYAFNTFGKVASRTTISFNLRTFHTGIDKPRFTPKMRRIFHTNNRRKRPSLNMTKKAKVSDEYLISEYPSDSNYFVVVLTDCNNESIYEKAGVIGDTIMIELCGNLLSYTIAGLNDDGSIRKTEIYVEPPTVPVSEINHEDYPNMIDNRRRFGAGGGGYVPRGIQEEYFISEEIVITGSGTKQMARLKDKNDKILDTKYGVKGDRVRLQVMGGRAVEYTIQGPIVTKFVMDQSTGDIEEEPKRPSAALTAVVAGSTNYGGRWQVRGSGKDSTAMGLHKFAKVSRRC